MASSTLSPTAQQERLFILDAIRGIALCGILILNIGYFARPYQAGFDLRVYHETGDANIISWFITNFIVEGSYRALFSMLFGAGCILLVSRLQQQQTDLAPADIYYKRTIWLLIFGLINAYIFLWPGDILYFYAVCGLFIFPLRNASVKLLIALAIFFIVVTIFKDWNEEQERLTMRTNGIAAAKLESEKKELSDVQKRDLEHWRDYLEKHKVENKRKEADREIAALTQSYAVVFKHYQPLNAKFESTKFYQDIFFDVMIFILLGMAFFKLGVLTGALPTWAYIVFVVAGYGFGITTGILTGRAMLEADFDIYEYLRITPIRLNLYQLHRLCMALGHIGAIILLWKSRAFSWFLKPLACYGQMAFTNYLSQSIFFALIFYGFGLSYFGKFERYELWYFVAGAWLFQIIFSSLWLKYFLFGPFEWLWRSLTYWKLQPIIRPRATVAVYV
jgi:uncharacterized protein